MCELLAVSSRRPVRITKSLCVFARRGGLDGPHADGWGIVFHEDGDARLIKEPVCAWSSPWVRLLQRQGPSSRTFLAHIRQATQGGRSLANTQPFVRELGGRAHFFAHNGNLASRWVPPPGRFRPVGDTDSERAFCALLNDLEVLWAASPGVPPLAPRWRAVQRFAQTIRAEGPSNFIYCDGATLFAHGDRRRRDGETEPREPGLFALRHHPVGEYRQRGAVLIASEPLTGEPWLPLESGRVFALERGRFLQAGRQNAAA